MHISSGHSINGKWEPGQGEAFTSMNPCDETIIWQGQTATQEEVTQAFNAANQALPFWCGLSLETRMGYIQQFIKQLKQHHTALISLLSLETGKPFWEAEQELQALCDKPLHALQAYQARMQETTLNLPDQTLHLGFKPLGVVAVLGAFNFPIHLSHGHLIPALLAGNTVVYKPSELTPAINERVMQCWLESGLPEGVLNLIQGNRQTAQWLIQTPIQAVYVTGSYQTGQAIQASLQSRPEVLLALEMGGNNPVILEQVKERDAAIYTILVSAFITAGQRCSCARRLMIPRGLWGDECIEKLIRGAKQLIVAPPDATPTPFMGPVIRRQHAQTHLAAQANLLKAGATSLLPMRLLSEKGGLLSPGLIMQHAPNDTEVFGPLLQLYRYDSFEEAIHLANQTQYGLTAGLISDSAQHYAYFYQHIRAGVLSWNRPTTGASSRLPFGGIGKSGNHRPSGYFAADYCVYPVASQVIPKLQLPSPPLPGIT